MLTLNTTTTIPEPLYTLDDVTKLHTIFPQPTLLHIEGRKTEPLFVSVLLHGNEDTGFFAIQQLLKKYKNQQLPRSLFVFFGNIDAAKAGARRLDNQPDYNRVWPGTTQFEDSAEAQLMAEVTERVAAQKPFASIDIHNNTGKNPHYGCINKLEKNFLHLTALFSRTVVFFETPKGVQSLAMAEHCPSVTIECGQPHLPQGIEHAAEFVDAVLHLNDFPEHPIHTQDIDVYHTVARVKIPEHTSFSFSDNTASLKLDTTLENDNFSELLPGAVFATTQDNAQFDVVDDNNNNRYDDFFTNENGTLKLTKPIMPAMITLNEKIIRQDCLCYLMERVDI
jgi:succinylglutamate desuccinylase